MENNQNKKLRDEVIENTQPKGVSAKIETDEDASLIVTKDKKTIVKRTTVLIAKIVAVFVAIVISFMLGFGAKYAVSDDDYLSLSFIFDAYKRLYYDAKDTSLPDALVEALMDRYSDYYTAEEYQTRINESKGSREGFGISLSGLKIYKITGNSPAEKSGLQPGGVITEYKKIGDDSFIAAETNEKLTEFLSSLKANDGVVMRVKYDEEIHEYTVRKQAYRETYVYYEDLSGRYRFSDDNPKNIIMITKYGESSLSLGEDWGYIKYTSFYGVNNGISGSSKQFTTAIDMFFENGRKNLIIDLRDNGGGYLSILQKLSGVLCRELPENIRDQYSGNGCQKAVHRNGEDIYGIDMSDAANDKKVRYAERIEKIVFLANSGSASASEALMGSVLDYDKFSGANCTRVILDATYENGKEVFKSYGKGIMQSTITNARTGEALKLTTAKLYWPLSGISIHGVGLTPELDERIFASDGDPIKMAQTKVFN